MERARHRGKNEVGRQGEKKGCGKSKRLGKESVCADLRCLLRGEELCETANVSKHVDLDFDDYFGESGGGVDVPPDIFLGSISKVNDGA